MRHARRLSYLLLALALVVLATACGSTTTVRVATVRFNLTWPTAGPGRLVPERAQSIRINVDNGNVAPGGERYAVAVRPATAVAIRGLLLGAATVSATAYPEANASGTPLATGSLSINVIAGDQVYGEIVMNSTIARIELGPQPASVPVGSTVPLTATARDSQGRMVLVAAANPFTWRVTGGVPFLALDGSTGGVVQATGVAAGTATVRATERESGRSGSLSVVVPVQGGDVGVVVQ